MQEADGKKLLLRMDRIFDNLLFPGDNVEKNSKHIRIQRIASFPGD